MLPDPELVASLLRQVAEHNDFDVIQVKVDGRRHVQMWVDREPDGVNVDDTTRLSRALWQALEEQGLDSGSFQLEVQSPGLDRLLAREKDFVRFAGEEVKVRLRRKQNNRANFTGKLVGWEDGHVVVAGPDGERWSFPLATIREARVVPDLPFPRLSESSGGNHRSGRSGRHRRGKKRGHKKRKGKSR